MKKSQAKKYFENNLVNSVKDLVKVPAENVTAAYDVATATAEVVVNLRFNDEKAQGLQKINVLTFQCNAEHKVLGVQSFDWSSQPAGTLLCATPCFVDMNMVGQVFDKIGEVIGEDLGELEDDEPANDKPANDEPTAQN